MRVEKLMTTDVKVCFEHETLNRAAQLMWESDCGCIPIIAGNDGEASLIGVITDRDIAMAAYTQGKTLWEIPVSIAMSRDVIVCHANDSVEQAEALMRENKIRRVPVVDRNNRVVGIMSLNDVAREAQREAGVGGRPEVSVQSVSQTLAAVCQPRTGDEARSARIS